MYKKRINIQVFFSSELDIGMCQVPTYLVMYLRMSNKARAPHRATLEVSTHPKNSWVYFSEKCEEEK